MNVPEALSTLKDEAGGDNALQLLYIASYFAPRKIKINVFSNLLDRPQDFKNALKLIEAHSLVQYVGKRTCIIVRNEVRREVQKFFRQTGEEEMVINLTMKVIEENLSLSRYNTLFHAMYVFSAAKAYPDLLKRESKFPSLVMNGLLDQDKYAVAFTFGREALEALEESIGAYHESTCNVQMYLGLTLLSLNKVDEGLAMMSESYRKSSVALGRCKVNLNLEVIAKITAESTTEPESRVRQLVFGDASVLETHNNTDLNIWCEYAMLLLTLKWKDEAMQILKQVLEKRLELLRPDDDDICRVEENIAEVHMVRQEYHEALEIYRRVHEKRKLALSENCIRTQYSRRRVALALDALNMMDEALVEYEAVAEGIRRIEGDESVAYLSTLSKIAFTLFRQKKYERAHVLYSRLYIDIDLALGEKDALTLDIKYNYGRLLLKRNRTEAALMVWQEILPHYIDVLGPEDSCTLDLMRNIDTLTLYRNLIVDERI